MDRSVRTFSDCVELLRDFQEFTDPRAERLAKRAVSDAYITFPTLHDWNFLKRKQLITTVAPYSTGTIEFDLTGGSRERLMTLTSGTWPTWAAEGRILIGETTYEIDERVSDTQIVLQSQNAPGADIAAGTTFILYKSRYAMLDEMQKYTACMDTSNQMPLMTSILESASMYSVWWNTPSTPVYCVQRSDNGQLEMEFYPPPDIARTYEITYVAVPRRFRLQKHSTGTATLTAGSRVVNFSSATLPTDIVGAVLRTGSSSNDPVGIYGSSDTGTMPFNEQYQILERIDDDSVRLAEPASASRTTVKFVIDDIIDLSPRIANEAFQRLVEQNFVANMRYADGGSADGGVTPASATERANRAIRLAMEADSMFSPHQDNGLYPLSPFDFATVEY